MRFSKKKFPKQIMLHQKQPKKIKYFKYLVSTITNDTRCTRKINYGIAIAEAAVYKMKTFGTSKLDLNLWEKLAKCYTLSTALYGAET
jgi:hypothetical protein